MNGHTRDRLGFCHSCGARNGEPHHRHPEPAVTVADQLSALAHRFVIIDGVWISPSMIRDATPAGVICTNNKIVKPKGTQ